MNFDGNFLLVNSLHLIIGNVEPNTVKLGESVSVSIYSNACSVSHYTLINLFFYIQITLKVQTGNI